MVSNCQLLSHASVVPSLCSNRWRPPETARDMCRDTSYAALTFPSLSGINPDPAANWCGLSNLKYVVMWNMESDWSFTKQLEYNIRFLSTYQKPTFQHSSHLTRTCTKVSQLFKQSTNTGKHYITRITPPHVNIRLNINISWLQEMRWRPPHIWGYLVKTEDFVSEARQG